MADCYDNEFLYNPGTDILLNWGDHSLERPGLRAEGKHLSDMLSTWDAVDLLEHANEAFPLILEKAEQARQFFIAHPILSSCNTSNLWREAVKALDEFDNLLFMWVVSAEILRDQSPEFVKRIEIAYGKLTDWIENSGDFSSLRLVPLNDWRRERLRRIPFDSQYLYPWYADLSEVESGAIDLISEDWNLILQNGYNALSFIPEENRPIVWHYLKKDKDLQTELTEKMRFKDAVIATIDQNLAIRLLHLSSIHALTRLAPDKFVSVGLKKIAYALLTDSSSMKEISHKDISDALENMMHKGTSMEKVLLTAFCGPGLSEKQRLFALKWIEQRMEDKGFVYRNDDLFATIHQWRNNEINDEVLVDSFFLYWDQLREDAFKLLTELPHPTAGDELLSETESVPRDSSFPFLYEPSFPSSEWQKNECCIMQTDYNAESDSDEEIVALQFKEEDGGNTIRLPLQFNDKGQPIVLKSPRSGKEKVRMDKVVHLLKNEDCSIGGWYETLSEGLKKIDIEYDVDDIEEALPASRDYKFIIIGVATNDDALEKAVSGDKPDDDKEASRICWIIYLPKEEK